MDGSYTWNSMGKDIFDVRTFKWAIEHIVLETK